jgi:hypothetical protein
MVRVVIAVAGGHGVSGVQPVTGDADLIIGRRPFGSVDVTQQRFQTGGVDVGEVFHQPLESAGHLVIARPGAGVSRQHGQVTLPPILVGHHQQSTDQTEALDDGITGFGSGVGGAEKSQGDGRIGQEPVGADTVGLGIFVGQRTGQKKSSASTTVGNGGRRHVAPEGKHMTAVRCPPTTGVQLGRARGTGMTGPAAELVIGHMVGAGPPCRRVGEPARPHGRLCLFSRRRLSLHDFLSAATTYFFNVGSTTRHRLPSFTSVMMQNRGRQGPGARVTGGHTVGTTRQIGRRRDTSLPTAERERLFQMRRVASLFTSLAPIARGPVPRSRRSTDPIE